MSNFPKIGQEVLLNYSLKRGDNTIIDTTNNKAPFSYILGSNKVYQEIDNEIQKMQKGEKKEIILSQKTIDDILKIHNKEEKGEIKCEIELIDFYDKIKSVFEMDTNEKKGRALLLKEEGVALFKSSDYKKAVEKFKEALSFVEKISEHEITEEIKTLKISLMLNSCNCSNRIQDYPSTISMAGNVISIKDDNAKSYYYRGMAYAYLDEFEKANADYTKLVSILKNEKDPGVEALRKLIDTRHSEKENKEKAKYKSIFKKRLYD